MKKKESIIHAYVPINFPNIDLLVKGTNLKPDKVRVLLHQLYLSRLYQSGYTGKQKNNPLNYLYSQGYVSLHSRVIISLLTSYYRKYLDFLEQKKLVTPRYSSMTTVAYTSGFTSIHYKIDSQLLHSPLSLRHFRQELITDKATINAVLKTKIKYQNIRPINSRSIACESIHEELFKMEQNIRFDLKAAELWSLNYLDSLINDPSNSEEFIERERHQIGQDLEFINAINEGYFTSKVDQFGERLHSPIKRVHTRMRQFMYFEGFEASELVSIDIRNSQLYFSTLLTNSTIVNSIIPEFSCLTRFNLLCTEKEDFKKYINTSIDGSIYDEWKLIMNFKSRDEAKINLFEVLFSSKYSKIKGVKQFKQNYPNVCRFFNSIKDLTEKDLSFITSTYLDPKGRYTGNEFHKNLSCSVQRLESRIFIKLICKELLQHNIQPLLSIHDSVFIPVIYQNEAISVINAEFIRLGINPPQLKIENVSLESNKIKNLR